jgi:hypothetical protein
MASRNNRVRLTPALERLFQERLEGATAEISNNVNYIEVLENGRVVNQQGRLQGSDQAPDGFVRAFFSEYEQIAETEVQAEYGIELRKTNPDLSQGVKNGIDSAAFAIASLLITRTPIDTSRARTSWMLETTDGEEIKNPGG